jgi:hypothetical protein
VAAFFIDYERGEVATGRQLVEAGVAAPDAAPARPWFPIQGTGDATTLWYAVMRKRTRGVFIGALAIRHGEHHASLLQGGWEEVPVAEIGAGLPARRGS